MTRRARPSIITLSMPQWLTAGIDFSVKAPRGTIGIDKEQAAIDELAADLRTVIPGCYIDRVHTSIAISPLWHDPTDLGERVAHAMAIEAALYERINGRVIGLADWAAAPLLRRYQPRATLAENQAHYAAVSAVRNAVLQPYLAGERKVGHLDAFRKVHTALDAVTAPIVRAAWTARFGVGGATQPSSRVVDTITLDIALKRLEELGLVELVAPRPLAASTGSPPPALASHAVRGSDELIRLHHDELLQAA